jgi:hypothetical protein
VHIKRGEYEESKFRCAGVWDIVRKLGSRHRLAEFVATVSVLLVQQGDKETGALLAFWAEEVGRKLQLAFEDVYVELLTMSKEALAHNSDAVAQLRRIELRGRLSEEAVIVQIVNAFLGIDQTPSGQTYPFQ